MCTKDWTNGHTRRKLDEFETSRPKLMGDQAGNLGLAAINYWQISDLHDFFFKRSQISTQNERGSEELDEEF